MNRRTSLTALAVILACCASAGAANPFLGSWRRNAGKSQAPGQAPRDFAAFRTYEERDGMMLHTIVYTSAQGASFVFAALQYDGKEYPVFTPQSMGKFVSGGAKPASTLSITTIDPGSFRYTDRLNAKVTAIGLCTVSSDGKTLTEQVTNFDASGKETFRATSVYDKQ